MTPNQLKYTKIGIAVVIGGFIIYKMIPASDSTGGATDPTGNGTLPAGSNPAFTFNAQKVANDLYDAMKTANFSHGDIIPILQRVSQTQFGQVVTAFGKRKYNSITGNTYTDIFGIYDLPAVDLKGWLKSELSTSDYNFLKLKYPNYL